MTKTFPALLYWRSQRLLTFAAIFYCCKIEKKFLPFVFMTRKARGCRCGRNGDRKSSGYTSMMILLSAFLSIRFCLVHVFGSLKKGLCCSNYLKSSSSSCATLVHRLHPLSSHFLFGWCLPLTGLGSSREKRLSFFAWRVRGNCEEAWGKRAWFLSSSCARLHHTALYAPS